MTERLIQRGEVWDLDFDPQVGDEITKVRPAVVLDWGSAKLRLRIIVPITGWQPSFEQDCSKVRLEPTSSSGLTKLSAADAYQVKSLSIHRFQRRLGKLEDNIVDEIALPVALMIDAPI